jgi:hypothetical protein
MEREGLESSPSSLVVAGVSSSQTEKSPPNFSWPVPEVTRCVTDFKNVHTEYRDSYPGWEVNKVSAPSLRSLR